jgi:hypothetical protein
MEDSGGGSVLSPGKVVILYIEEEAGKVSQYVIT